MSFRVDAAMSDVRPRRRALPHSNKLGQAIGSHHPREAASARALYRWLSPQGWTRFPVAYLDNLVQAPSDNDAPSGRLMHTVPNGGFYAGTDVPGSIEPSAKKVPKIIDFRRGGTGCPYASATKQGDTWP